MLFGKSVDWYIFRWAVAGDVVAFAVVAVGGFGVDDDDYNDDDDVGGGD